MKLRRSLVLAAIVGGAAGVAMGAWVDRTWPNPVYGAQLIMLVAGILLVLLGLLVARRGPMGQAFAASAVALLCGMAGGAQFLGAPDPINTYGTMTLRIDGSAGSAESGRAACEVAGEEVTVTGDFDNVPIAGGMHVSVILQQGERATSESGTLRPDRRFLTITFSEMESKLTPSGSDALLEQGGEAYTTEGSLLVGEVRAASGAVRFAELAAFSYSEIAPVWIRDLDLAGTIEWACVE